MTSLIEIESIGFVYLKRLAKAGIKTTQSLLAHAYDPKGRQELRQATGLSEKSLSALVNKAGILQIKGIGPEYADLLEYAGVDTLKKLSSRKPEKLAAQISKVNKEKNLVRQLPTREQIKAWTLDAIAIHSAPLGLTGARGTGAPPPQKKRSTPKKKRYAAQKKHRTVRK